jgi:hypothetical protein
VSEDNSVKQRYAINFRGSVHDRAIALRDLTLVGEAEVKDVVALINKLDADYQQSARPLDAAFSTMKVVPMNVPAWSASRPSKPAPCRWPPRPSRCAMPAIPKARASWC